MLLDLWGWVGDLKQGQATVLGLVGGFFTLVVGALINACLNRRRDDRLRRQDQRAMAVALKTELAEWVRVLQAFPSGSSPTKTTATGFPVPTTRLLPHMVSKLGLLRPATIDHVIAAYDHVEHLVWALVWNGAEMERSPDLHTRWITVPTEKLPSAIEEVKQTAQILNRAVADLDRYEPLVRRWLRRLTGATAPVKRTALTNASAGERQ